MSDILEHQALGEVDELPDKVSTVTALLESIDLRIFNVIMEGHILFR